MTREEKTAIIEELKEKFANTPYFYIVDASGFSVAKDNDLRRACFNAQIEYRVVKNSLIKKALEALDTDYQPFVDEKVLKGYSGVMFSDTGNKPARLIKDFRKKNNTEKPIIKGASIDTSLYIGDHQLEALCNVKSKAELLGEVIGLLQSPMANLIGALQGQGGKIAGILKTLEEKKS
ncbi:50S ribosomal protein L10 [Raineya orbicola]|jgi:large subunit ribosomal protein L10|uniref:Large ribosomal subunit protein uL10 n=1 Tax=Raineya orbicola TaxID=2016530 RepID=A0A2N3IHS6_9BACT|nr:50S ribosomal protein L10 [Raineya orbicola]PKQ69856.1 Ribosomal protein L10 [Raineya orbicola]